MKAFEDAFGEMKTADLIGIRQTYYGAVVGWKAALGEVLRLRETCPKGKDFEEYISEWIEQELNG